MPDMCDLTKFLKWYDFKAIFYSNIRLAALHYAASCLKIANAASPAHPRMWPHIDIVPIVAVAKQ